MNEINEKLILRKKMRVGVKKAKEKFKQYYTFNIEDKNDPYMDLIEQIFTSIGHYWIFDNTIDVVYIDKPKYNLNLLDILISLIRQETYKYGLRIMKNLNNNFLYLYIDKVYNNETYYVDDKNKMDDIEKSLESKH